ncbi:MAG: phage Gp37/Gp68 family protein [Actinomycetota bacterium]
MSERSAIEWTEATWNPVTGCSKVSPGCDNCYAERLAVRLRAMRNARYTNGFEVTLHDDQLDLPLRWRTPRTVFVNSMSDLFHERVPDEYIARVFEAMGRAHWHTFQVLTKRPGRMASLVARILPDPLPNVWLGTSIELDRYVWRADRIRETPAAVRFLSCEPLLGPLPNLVLVDIDWMIVGGESGPGHRPVLGSWVEGLRDRCVEAGVPFFFKQWGGRTPTSGGRSLEGRDWAEMPSLAP